MPRQRWRGGGRDRDRQDVPLLTSERLPHGLISLGQEFQKHVHLPVIQATERCPEFPHISLAVVTVVGIVFLCMLHQVLGVLDPDSEIVEELRLLFGK